MSIPEVVKNTGNFFVEGALVDTVEKYEDEAALRDQFEQMREHFERRLGEVNDESDAQNVGFSLVSHALHILGYTHSHNETLPNNAGRIDYTLFDNADDFQSHQAGRGTGQFFAGAVAVLRSMGWSDDLDVDETDEAMPEHPAFQLDEVLRNTGLQWGILSNGRLWRLFHRNTAGMLNTYFEIDLAACVRTADFDAFKYFACLFGKPGLVADSSGTSIARTLLD